MKHLLVFASCLFLVSCGSAGTIAPVSTYGASSGAGTRGVHVVQSGDTLWSISNRYNLGMRDIVLANNIGGDFILHPGQRLRLPPPRQYRVREGDSLYTVSRMHRVGMNTLARLNNLSAPYVIRPGQNLRLPSSDPVVRNTQAAAVTPSAKPSLTGSKPAVKRSPVSTRPPPRSSGKFYRPVDGRVLSSYGPKKGGLYNDGVNIAAARGTPVGAAENGVVVYAGDELKGSGNLVLVRHDGGYLTAYAHLDRISVPRGAIVKKGQAIGQVGSSGSVSSPQLHFEVRKGTRALDPKNYISL